MEKNQFSKEIETMRNAEQRHNDKHTQLKVKQTKKLKSFTFFRFHTEWHECLTPTCSHSKYCTHTSQNQFNFKTEPSGEKSVSPFFRIIYLEDSRVFHLP